MTIARSIALFVLAAVAEIGGAWLIWQGWREHRGLWRVMDRAPSDVAEMEAFLQHVSEVR